jgi:hypothetical protein
MFKQRCRHETKGEPDLQCKEWQTENSRLCERHETEELRATIAQQERVIEKLMGAVEFYANKANYMPREGCEQRLSEFEYRDCDTSLRGGKRARQCLAEVAKLMEGKGE